MPQRRQTATSQTTKAASVLEKFLDDNENRISEEMFGELDEVAGEIDTVVNDLEGEIQELKEEKEELEKQLAESGEE